MSGLVGSIFAVILRTKSEESPFIATLRYAQSDILRLEIYQSKLDGNGLLLDFVFQCSSPKGEVRWGAIQNRSPSNSPHWGRMSLAYSNLSQVRKSYFWEF